MTPDQITQLRTLLKRAKENGPGTNVLIDKALTLLPCPTCNGTRTKTYKDETRDGISTTRGPCPDCQPRYCVCCEEVTKENAHLHRNCGK